MFEVKVTGIGEVQTWLTKVEAGLEKVPENFSARGDVKQALLDIARGTLVEFDIKDTEVALNNLRAESTPDNKGIMVYEAYNKDTETTYGNNKGEDPYLMFFLAEYAGASFLLRAGIETRGRDFFALWPQRMKPVVVDAFEEEIRKALRT